MGASSVLNVVFGVLKMKVAALLLGPAGVGLIGIYQNLLQTAATVASLGVGTAGTRQIAAAQGRGDAAAAALTHRALFWGTLALAVLGVRRLRCSATGSPPMCCASPALPPRCAGSRSASRSP